MLFLTARTSYSLAFSIQFRRVSTYKHLSARKQSFIPSEGTYPHGFLATGIHCGVKKPGIKDLALVLSERACTGAAVFTTNKFQAAPVKVSQETLKEHNGSRLYGIVTNSGCANAVTGSQGIANAKRMRDAVDALVKQPKSALVMSTGVIGQQLPIETIEAGIRTASGVLSATHEAWLETAEAFMTTDTFPKLLSGQFELQNKPFRMAGIAKGAGMIHPNMATLLGFMVTDAEVKPELLQKALKYAADRSFNAISVDGDMSTNDTISVLANGASGVKIESEGPDYELFRDRLTEFAAQLAQLVVRDGEGATKFVTIHVKGGETFESAKQAASHIATSMLVKTALYGQDANWGRICASLGHSGVDLDPSRVSVKFLPTDGSKPLQLMENGEPEVVNEERASEILKMEDLIIEVDLNLGNSDAKFWTCDLSHEYVTINADYRS